jgi:RNA polymerase sigma factor (sigma-70 family)
VKGLQMNDQQDDGQLLRAFNEQGDESAFAELMRRHGGLVRIAVCNVTGDTNMADDIVQATFLALIRKARSLDTRKSTLAGWLYHVATCLARNARRDEYRRKAREEEAYMLEYAAGTDTSTTLGEAALATLCEELGNLAEKYRQPLILHHLEGMSYEAAATLCDCTETTFGARLTRGREKLRGRLMKRGVTLGAAALIVGLGQTAASAAPLSEALVSSTCQAAVGMKAGGMAAATGGGLISAKVAALTDSVLKMLFWGQVKTVAGVAAAALITIGGTGYVWQTVHDDQASHEARVVASPAPQQTVDKAGDERAAAEDWLKPLPSNEELAAITLEDGEIIFHDDFTNGLANWELLRLNPATKQFEPLPEALKDSVKIVSMNRGDQEIKAVRVDETNEVVMLALRQPIRERWFAVEFEDHFRESPSTNLRLAVSCLGTFGLEELVPFKNTKRTFSDEERKTQWWRVRWEFCCGTDPQGRPSMDYLRQVGAEESRGRARGFLYKDIVRPCIAPGSFLISHVTIRRLVPKERADKDP